MRTGKKAIETKALSVGYANGTTKSVVLDNIDISLYQGKLIAMVGENGIGKSTLLRSLCGLQKPLSGDILLQSEPIAHYNHAGIAKLVSIVLTEKLPAGNLTVYELVALGRQPYTNWLGTLAQEDRAAIAAAISLTGIGALTAKKHYEISDGQLQNVMIARAIAQDTPVIMLDEPTTHLDLVHKLKLFALLRKLAHEQQKCILFSTHDIELSLVYCDELITVTSGSVLHGDTKTLVDHGALESLFSDPSVHFDSASGRFRLADR